MSGHGIDPRHDLVHEPDPSRERWRESYYFNVYDFDLGLGIYSSIGYRPSKGYSGSMQAVWGPDRPTLFAFEHGTFEQHTDEHLVAGLSYTCREPFGAWHVGFEGPLNDGGSGPACEMEAVTRTRESASPKVDVAYDLTFTPDQPPYLYRENPEWAGLFDGHLDEVGSVTGTVTIDGETLPFSGRGAKDHSWGVRDWALPKGWRWTDMLFTEGPEVALWRATFDGERWVQDGAIYTDGVADPLVSFREHIEYDTSRAEADRPRAWEFEVVTENHRVRGRAEILRVVPLLFPIRDETGARATMWNDRSVFRCELEDGRVGVGSAEFQFRRPESGRAPHPLSAPPPDGLPS